MIDGRYTFAVTGGRDFGDARDGQGLLTAQAEKQRLAVVSELMLMPYGAVMLNGRCPTGLDAFAFQLWADTWDEEVIEFPADWDLHGKAAGPIRNQQMIDAEPDLLIAFPGGHGTADCIKRAKAARIPIRYAEV